MGLLALLLFSLHPAGKGQGLAAGWGSLLLTWDF